jgi:hypothetical protein
LCYVLNGQREVVFIKKELAEALVIRRKMFIVLYAKDAEPDSSQKSTIESSLSLDIPASSGDVVSKTPILTEPEESELLITRNSVERINTIIEILSLFM